MKNKWIAYTGERLRGFKTQLISGYITHPKHKLEPLYVMYKLIRDDTLKKFDKSHNTPKFLSKSQKEKENRAKKYIHVDCPAEDVIKWNM